MKIVYDHQIFRAQPYGGVSRYFFELASRLSVRNECDVEIFAPFYVNEYLGKASDIRIWGKRFPKLPHTGYLQNSINTTLTRLMVTPRKDIDIFHETFFTRANNGPRSAKRLLTVHDMIHEKLPEYCSNSGHFQSRKASAVKRADHVICVSESTRRDLIALLNVPEAKISVVYHGHSLACPPDTIRPVAHEKPFVLYVGSRGGYKNFVLLLRAFAASQLLKEDFSIVCFGGGKTTSGEMDLVNSLGLASNAVDFVAGDDSVLAGLYASAKAFVYPSLYEGFGIPPLEAMAFGCPVVCANTSSLPEVVGDAAELFDPESETELRAAMEKVVFSQDHAERLIAKGRERIKRFSWEKCAQETLAVYKKVLSS